MKAGDKVIYKHLYDADDCGVGVVMRAVTDTSRFILVKRLTGKLVDPANAIGCITPFYQSELELMQDPNELLKEIL